MLDHIRSYVLVSVTIRQSDSIIAEAHCGFLRNQLQLEASVQFGAVMYELVLLMV